MRYEIIYADPPWAYKVWSKKGKGRSAESHYKTMNKEDIMKNNRSILTSPRLILEKRRLVRKIEIAQEVFLNLITQYEITKIEQVKDTPVLNIMEKAEQPIEKTGPKRFLIYYLVTGIGAALVHYIVFYFEIQPTLSGINSFHIDIDPRGPRVKTGFQYLLDH